MRSFFVIGVICEFLNILKACMNLHEFVSVHFRKNVMLPMACTVYDGLGHQLSLWIFVFTCSINFDTSKNFFLANP